MCNPLREVWLHGPDADPDPAVAEAIALITEYQLDLLSDIERQSVEHRLAADPDFAALAAPMLFAARVMRCDGEQQRRADGEADRVARLLARLDEERTVQHDTPETPHTPVASGSPAGAKPAARERHQRQLPHSTRPRRRWFPAHGSIAHASIWQLAASILVTAAVAVCAATAYAAVLRSRIPPVSVIFTNAPLSVVMAELRRHYHIDVQVCDAGFYQDRVTMTITDAPIDSVADVIAQQTLRWAHWKVPYTGGPYTVLLQPQPDLPRGWGYNLRLFARSLTYLGCHR